ncbi:MAG: YecA family protein [Pseudonocardiaceae bacterium]
MAAETEPLTDVETVAGMITGDQPPDGDRTRLVLEAVAVATDDALRVISDRIECHTAHGGTVSAQLAALRGEARSRETKAAVAFFAARAAEGAGDSATARIRIDEALTLRPGLEPALHDAAQYSAIRGDYPIADRYLRRAEVPSPLRPGLSDALAVTAGNVARNDPCPCGSGRKFKVCCRRDGAPPLAARAPLLYALLGTYAERGPGLEITTPLIERTEDAQRCAMFCVDLALFRGGLVEKFLAARGHWLRPDEHDLITAWQQVPFTLYETLEVQRDTGVTLRALPDGEPIHLPDVQFSHSAQRLELICGRLLHNGTEPVMLAIPVHIARHHRRAMLELLAADPTAERLADFLAPEPPVQIRNSDGEDLHDCSVTYRVPDPEHTFEALTERLTRTSDDVVARRRPVPDGRVLSLGQIHRDGDEFTLNANSPARLAELEAVLRDVAPDAAEQDRRAERLSPDPCDREPRVLVKESYYLDAGSDDDTDNTVAAAERMSRDAETAWLDTPGVIGDLSPRETAATDDPALRAELRSLIDDVEATLLQAQRAGRPSAGLMDPQRLRDALELSRTGPPGRR